MRVQAPDPRAPSGPGVARSAAARGEHTLGRTTGGVPSGAILPLFLVGNGGPLLTQGRAPVTVSAKPEGASVYPDEPFERAPPRRRRFDWRSRMRANDIVSMNCRQNLLVLTVCLLSAAGCGTIEHTRIVSGGEHKTATGPPYFGTSSYLI